MINYEKHKFLLVEDFELMRGILRALLRRCGAKHIDTATNGREALQQLQREKYSVILCDYNLGAGKTGQNLLEEARHNHLIGPATVWIMITAEKTTEMVSSVAEHAPDDYLVKPIIEATLSNRLEKLIARKAMLSDIAAAMGNRQYLRALDLCRERLAQDKGNPTEVLRLQADLCRLTGQLDEARAIYGAVLARRSVAWAKLGLARLSFQENDLARTRGLLEEVVADHPQYLEAYDLLASVHQAQGANEEEESVLLRAIALSPMSASRQTALGHAALLCGHADVAEKALHRAIKLGEHSAVRSAAPFLGLARMHATANRPQDALQVLGEVAQLFTGEDVRIQAKMEEVRVLYQAGDPRRAAEVAQEVCSRIQACGQSLGSAATLEYAETLMRLGSRDEAALLLQFVVRNNDEDEAIGARAQAVFDQGDMGDAGRALLGQSRQQARTAMNEGVGLLAEGKLTEALECMRAAAELMPRNLRVLLNLAYVLIVILEKKGWRRDVEDEARKAITTARGMAPGEKRVGELLARLEGATNSRPASS